MQLEDFRAKLTALAVGLEAEAVRINTGMAVSALSIVKNRSTDDGILVNGSKVPYSTNVIPSFFLKKSVQNSRGEQYIKDNKFSTYGNFKEAQGLKGDYVNLSLSNRMWSNLSVKEAAFMNGIASAKIGATDPEVLKYLVYLFRKYPGFLKPTELEIRLISEDGAKEYLNYFKRMLA